MKRLKPAMKSEQSRYRKVKFFLFLLFVGIAVIFVSQVVKLSRLGFYKINKNYDEFKCVDLNYRIQELSYENKRLRFDLINQDADSNIGRITIKSDTNESEFVYNIDPVLKMGEAKIISFNDINLSEGFTISIDNCPQKYMELK